MYTDADTIKDRLRKITLTHPTKTQAMIAELAGLKASNLSMILKKERRGTLDQIINVAKAADTSIEEIIDEIRGNRVTKKIDLDEHQILVKNFINPKRGLEINKKLIELEKLDPTDLDDVLDYIEHKIDKKKRAKKTPEKTGT